MGGSYTKEFENLVEIEYKYNSNELGPVDEKQIFTISSGLEELDNKIDENMVMQDGGWACKLCGKYFQHKIVIKNHIEAKHITGMEHPCNTCGKKYRSRNSLRK